MAALLNDLKTQGGSSVLVVLDVVCHYVLLFLSDIKNFLENMLK